MADKIAGFVKIYRSMLEWEWFTEPSTAHLFLYCLLRANRKEGKGYKGTDIPVGSFVTSIERLSTETGLTKQQVRTALNKLKSTHEITSKSTNKGTLVNIVKWVHFQDESERSNMQNNIAINKPITNEQQTNNKPITTNKNIRSKEVKNNIKEKNIKKENSSLAEEKPLSTDKPLPDKKIIISLPLANNEFYEVYENDLKTYCDAYPDIDMQQELKKMKAWLESNPNRRKQRRGVKRFINSWLSREQSKEKVVFRENTSEYQDRMPVYDETNNPIVNQEEIEEFFRDWKKE